jgi:Dickkopf-like protein
MPQENSPEQQRMLMQAALLWQTQVLYETAHRACNRTGAYENGATFKLDVLAVIEDAVQKLETLQKGRAASAGPGRCSSNEECPPAQICVNGQCVNPFSGVSLGPN